jgi:hypothetical protein
VGLTVEVKVRDVFTRKTVIAVYPENLQVSYDATETRKPKLGYVTTTNYMRSVKTYKEKHSIFLNYLLLRLLNVLFSNG